MEWAASSEFYYIFECFSVDSRQKLQLPHKNKSCTFERHRNSANDWTSSYGKVNADTNTSISVFKLWLVILWQLIPPSYILQNQMWTLFTQQAQWVSLYCVTIVTDTVSVTLVSLHQMVWKASLSSSGQSSVRKTLSSGWPVKNTRPLIQTPSCCPKPNVFIRFILIQMPQKRWGI